VTDRRIRRRAGGVGEEGQWVVVVMEVVVVLGLSSASLFTCEACRRVQSSSPSKFW
jgi:hypothetical protein